MQTVQLKDLLEAGVHFGHQVRKWNPKMRKYIYASRDGIHVIDLLKTKELLDAALEKVKAVASTGKPIIFVGTKRQAQEVIAEEAKRVGVHHVTVRWLGGVLTNWEEIKKTIQRLTDLEIAREQGTSGAVTKKEKLLLDREIARLDRFVGGLKGMVELPALVFIVDIHKDEIAAKEAKSRGIPVVAICDTNTDPTLVDYPIPGNDDAIRSVRLIVKAVADAVVEGKKHIKVEAKEEKVTPALS
ncbi:MAG: 30S ribosomal protein S2 [bacterium]|nr:30S ribosomal protein S2 [bacterium]